MAALDFWLGDWQATWDGGSGRNQVTREVGGQVIVERFEAAGDEPFSGISVSVADASGAVAADLGRLHRQLLDLRRGSAARWHLPVRDERAGRLRPRLQTDGVLEHRGGRLRLALGVLAGRRDLGAAMGHQVHATLGDQVRQQRQSASNPPEAYCVRLTLPPVNELTEEHRDCACARVPTPAYQTGMPPRLAPPVIWVHCRAVE